MVPFKKGDLLTCIDTGGNPDLAVGEKYICLEVSQGPVTVRLQCSYADRVTVLVDGRENTYAAKLFNLVP